MKILHNDIPFFHISIENIFSEENFNEIFDEIKSLKTEFKTEEFTRSSFLPNGKILKKNKGIYLDELENSSSFESIKQMDNILKKISIDKNWKNFTFKRIFNSLLWGNDHINYYEENDHYMPHTDMGVFTLIIWMYDDRIPFLGGNLYFPEYNFLHECKNNCGILFFSKELHGVTPITSCKNNYGRYSIVSFSCYSEKDNSAYRNLNANSKKLIYH